MIGSRLLLVGAVATGLSFAGAARAQPSAAAVAQVLFEEGVALMEEHRLAEACPKLAESQRIDPGGGTLLNLGACWEGLGKFASAYATYNEAASAAVKDGRRDREDLARKKLVELRPKMSYVRVVASGPREGVEITLDDTRIGSAALGVPLPIDPGPHVLAARAPGYRGYERRFEALPPGETTALEVPALEPERREPAPLPLERPKPKPSGPHALVLPLGVLGGALVVLGGVSGGVAFAEKAASDAGCPTATTCSEGGAAAMDRAVGFAWGSTVALGVGATALAAAAVLYFSDRGGRTTASRAQGVLYTW